MSSSTSILNLIVKLKTFQDRLNELEDESINKGGIADGFDHEIEYWGNFANAVVYTATSTLSNAMLEKFLKDYTDILGIADSLSDYTGDSVGKTLKEYWYGNRSKFEQSTNSLEILHDEYNNTSLVSLLDVEKSIQSFYDKNFIDTLSYERLTQNLTNYLVNTTSVYTPLVNNYFTPINIGAFYESSTSQEVSFIKSKNTIRFYQANSNEVA